jgi:transcriptional regulator with XRE-family HTH domain
MKRKRRKRIPSTVGQRMLVVAVKEMREYADARGLSVSEWASKADVSPSTVYNILNGVVPFTALDTVMRLADAAGLLYLPQRGGGVRLALKENPRRFDTVAPPKARRVS